MEEKRKEEQVSEINEEELDQVTGGVINPDRNYSPNPDAVSGCMNYEATDKKN